MIIATGRSCAKFLITTLVVAVVAALIVLPPQVALGQFSQPVPLPADQRQPIRFGSRLIEHWYEQDKMHVFMLLDGVRIEQGQWQLKARDAVIWLDEAAAAEGEVKLGIYAEGDVSISSPQFERERQYEFVYLTLTTSGELERDWQIDREVSRADTPLFLRSRRMRERALAAAPEPGLVPEVSPPAPETPALPEAVPPVAGEAPQRLIIRPRDAQRPATLDVRVVDDRRVAIWTGGVMIIYGDTELLADEAVVWTNADEDVIAERGEQPEVYLEGDVIVNVGRHVAEGIETAGNTQMRASRLFIDLDRQLALIIDAQVRGYTRGRDVPVYYYAQRARQAGQGRFLAEKGTFTTSSMCEPQIGLHGSRMEVVDLSGRDEETGEMIRRVRYDIHDVVTTAHGIPIFYWPRLSGDVEDNEIPLRRLSLSQRSSRGTGIETQWYLWRLLGIGDEPQGFRKTYLDLNYYGERGPYVAVESRYFRENFYGDFLANFIYDSGTDRINGQRLDPPREERGRVRLRHRQFLPRDWQATVELSYLSDRQFLPEWYEAEDREGKDQETLLHLKKQDPMGIDAISLLVKGKLNDWLTQSQYAPRLEYHRIGQPLWDTGAVYYTDNVYQFGQYSPDDALPIAGSPWGSVADTRHRADLPLQVGFAKVVPFADGRLSYFEHRPDGRGPDWRTFGVAGVYGSFYLTRQYDEARSRFWDVNRIRHINTFDFRVMQAATDLGSRWLYPWDEPGSAETKLVRGIDDTDVYQVGWRQRWQTKRGPTQRTVDLVTLDMLMTWFGDVDNPRVAPGDDLARNNLTVDYSWQISDTTSLVGDLYYATSDGQLRLSNVGLAVIRSPRFSYYVGNRYIRGADSSMLTFGLDYVINRKWSLHLFEQFDIDAGNRNSSTRLELTRTGESWKTIISVELVPNRDEKIFYIQFQPIGVPEVRLGN